MLQYRVLLTAARGTCQYFGGKPMLSASLLFDLMMKVLPFIPHTVLDVDVDTVVFRGVASLESREVRYSQRSPKVVPRSEDF